MTEFEKPVYLLNVGYNAIDVTGFNDPTAWQNGDPAAWLETEGVVWVPVQWNEADHPYFGTDQDFSAQRDATYVAWHALMQLGLTDRDVMWDAMLYCDELPTIQWGLQVYTYAALAPIFEWPDGIEARYSLVTTYNLDNGEPGTYPWYHDLTYPKVKERLQEYVAKPYPLDSNPRIVRTK